MRNKIAIRIFFGFFLITMLLVISLLVAEIACRVSHKYPLTGIAYFKNEIWRWNPGLNYLEKDNTGNEINVSVNSRGFRDEEHSKDKKDDEIRILVIGDSYTAGLYLPLEKRYTNILETELAKSTNKKIEVINAGVPAWGTDQQYIYLLNEGLSYHPDYVFLLVCPNDIREAYCKKFLELKDDGTVKVNPLDYKKDEIINWKLSNKSCFYQYLRTKKYVVNDVGTFENLMRHFRFNFGVGDSTSWDRPVFLKNEFAELTQAKKLYKTLLTKMNEECVKSKAKFAIGVIPLPFEVDTLQQDTEIKPGILTEQTRQIADEMNVGFIDLFAPATREVNPQQLFLVGDAHFSAYGNAFTADKLLAYYKAQLKGK